MAKICYCVLFMMFETLLCLLVRRQGKNDIIKNIRRNKCNEWEGSYNPTNKNCVCQTTNFPAKLFLSESNGSPSCVYRNVLACRVVTTASKQVTLSLDGNYDRIVTILLWNTRKPKRGSGSYSEDVIGVWNDVTNYMRRYFTMTSSSFLKAKLNTVRGEVLKLLFNKSGTKCLILRVKGNIEYPFDMRVFGMKTTAPGIITKKVGGSATSSTTIPAVTNNDKTKLGMIIIGIVVAAIVVTVAILVTCWKITTCKKELRKRQAMNNSKKMSKKQSRKNVERAVRPEYRNINKHELPSSDYESPMELNAGGTHAKPPGADVYYTSIISPDADYETPTNLQIRAGNEAVPGDEVYYSTIESLSGEMYETKSGYSSLQGLKDDQYCSLNPMREENYDIPQNETDVVNGEISNISYQEFIMLETEAINSNPYPIYEPGNASECMTDAIYFEVEPEQ